MLILQVATGQTKTEVKTKTNTKLDITQLNCV